MVEISRKLIRMDIFLEMGYFVGRMLKVDTCHHHMSHVLL
jgi:hypothetical protein